MESFLLNWPEEENWYISHSHITGEGDVLVFEFLKEGENKESWTELASMTTHVGAQPENPQLIWQNLIKEAKEKFPGAKVALVEEATKEKFPWGMYTVEGNNQSTICHLVKGDEGLYMNAVVFPKNEIPPSIKDKWISFFKAGEILPQSLQETMMSNGVSYLNLPKISHHHKKQPIQEIPSEPEVPIKVERTHIAHLFHPNQPNDLAVSIWENNAWEYVWVKIIKEEEGLYQGAVLDNQLYRDKYPPFTIIYFRYEKSIRQMVRVNPIYLAEIKDWTITPCNQCGFSSLIDAPSAFISGNEETLYFETECPICKGIQTAAHKHYIPPIEPLEEEKVVVEIPWWKFWLKWKNADKA